VSRDAGAPIDGLANVHPHKVNEGRRGEIAPQNETDEADRDSLLFEEFGLGRESETIGQDRCGWSNLFPIFIS
jgi:hypothetical protein